jgi:phospholipid/cholesterol/gamma-HCH transport system ATP-binding protein
MAEALQLVDYVYFMSDGVIITQGTPAELRASDKPFVRQFVHGDLDGPIPFHYPAEDYARDLFSGNA